MLINILFHPVYKGKAFEKIAFEFNLPPRSNDWSYVRKACNSLVWNRNIMGGYGVVTIVAEIYIGRFRILRTSNPTLIKVLK